MCRPDNIQITSDCSKCQFIDKCQKKFLRFNGNVEIYVTDKEIIVCGDPEELIKMEHSCDEMGCSSVSHVIFRQKIERKDANPIIPDWLKEKISNDMESYIAGFDSLDKTWITN